MYNRSESNPILINCTFSGNSATYYGGGMCNRDSRPTLSNCTLATNSAQNGNALACGSYKWKHIELINCILWDGGNEIWNNDNSTIAITFSNIHGGFPGESNIDSDPYFVDPGYWADVNDPDIIVEPNDPNAIWIDGDYHLKSVAGRWDPNSQSWVLDDVRSPCIDTGDPNSCIGFEPNPNGNVVNMGAYGGTAEASLSPSGINCISDDHQDYDEWVKVGEPVCWCYQRQCHGDADCKFEGKNKYWVSTNDLDILIAAWSKPFAEIEGQTLYGLDLVCADFDHKAQGKRKYRVSVNDLDILIAGWNKADEPDPNCP